MLRRWKTVSITVKEAELIYLGKGEKWLGIMFLPFTSIRIKSKHLPID